MVLALRQRLASIDVHGLGGVCRWSGTATGAARAAIAWGGVLAQLALFGTTWAWLRFHHGAASTVQMEFADVFTRANLTVAAINLVPVPPLDGAEAWKIVRYLRWPKKRRSLPAPAAPPASKARHVLPVDGESPDPPLPEEVRLAVERILEESRGKGRPEKMPGK